MPFISAVVYYRNRNDFIRHLAVELASHYGFEFAVWKTNDIRCDVNEASDKDIAAARALLERAGIRTPDQSPPAWHFVKPALSRGSETK